MSFCTIGSLILAINGSFQKSICSKRDEAFRIRAQVHGPLLHGFLHTARNGSPVGSALPGSIDRHQLSRGHERCEEFFDFLSMGNSFLFFAMFITLFLIVTTCQALCIIISRLQVVERAVRGDQRLMDVSYKGCKGALPGRPTLRQAVATERRYTPKRSSSICDRPVMIERLFVSSL